MSTSGSPTHLRGRIAFWALAGVALLVSHDAIYVAQVGPGAPLVAALRTAGHGYWGWASLLLTAVALIASMATWLRIRRLRRRASTLGVTRIPTGPFTTRFAAAWLRLSCVVTLGFLVQENVEHLIVHGHAMGAEALLGPEHPLALPVIGLISAIAAAIATVIAATTESFVAAIEEAIRCLSRPSRTGRHPIARPVFAIGPILSRRGAGRAPPALVVSGT